MSNDSQYDDEQSQEEWDTYLQVFLDESDEDLESLGQALLRLEGNPQDADSLNEAFRLLHTHKSSAGLMGFEGISHLAHELENRFDQLRSGKGVLDRARITVFLRCVDFLRAFNARIRGGEPPEQDASAVLDSLVALEKQEVEAAESGPPSELTPAVLQSLHGGYRVRVEFEEGLQLADMKARLIVARISNVGQIIAMDPPVEEMESCSELTRFVFIVLTDRDPVEVQKIANVDGVKLVQIEGGPSSQESGQNEEFEVAATGSTGLNELPPAAAGGSPQTLQPATEPPEDLMKTRVAFDLPAPGTDAHPPQPTPSAAESPGDRGAVTETVRVGIDRLDHLMNLTGELIVTRARLTQITGELNSVFRGRVMARRADEVRERLELGISRIVKFLATQAGQGGAASDLIDDLKSELEIVQEQSAEWDRVRQQFTRITETVDQLSRVSGNLQQIVLDTRMVPVAPLFNRFRRVIRDLAGERDKKVQLVIRGEKTELDKRMIDELGDPLLHLIRNSLDHGLELPSQRRELGKSDTGSIVLEAAHRGNNVFITISDDGAGIKLERLRQRILERSLASQAAVDEMNEQQVIEHIWLPGFSTAEKVTDISGRGVGMDVVRNRIAELNGSIEVETTEGEGTRFKIRLPLTLAIIRCLQVRFRQGVFSMPIDDVREIVGVPAEQVHDVHGNETIDVRGEFIPLIRMERIFSWHTSPALAAPRRDVRQTADMLNVVVLRAAGRTFGLCVDELLGNADIVVKSLSDNYTEIRGLSGASIMGDGAVCLMLDIGEILKMAGERSKDGRTSLSS